MNAPDIKKLQAPLKEQYRNDPQSAIITLRAQGKIGENISCNVDTARHLIEAGLHPATGGDGSQACSGDMLLQALVACAGVTLNAVATAMEVPINDAVIKAEGDLDFRGTLGVSKDAPVGFKEIRITFIIDSDAAPDKIETLLKLTERYCVVFQTLKNGVSVKAELQRDK